MSSNPEKNPPARQGNVYLAVFLAWLIPGSGHAMLGLWRRAALFFGVVITTLSIGCWLEGRMSWVWQGSPIDTLLTLGGLGSGLPALILRFVFQYEGTLESAGYEYGGAFVVTAGLMNILLVLDTWDIYFGRKE